MRRAGISAVALLAFVLLPLAGWARERQIAVIIDTSGSMRGSDPPRYTVLLAQILGDLLAPEDVLTVVRLPRRGSCSDGPSNALAVRLEAARRQRFKEAVDGLIDYGGDNHFAAPVRTAIAALAGGAGSDRMLLMIADSGGLAACERPLTRELVELHAEGVTIAAINIGSSAGAFDANPAFDFTTAALDPEQIIASVALVYQRFLGAKQVQTGRVTGTVTVEIAPLVEEAFLVVAADGPIAGLRQAAGNPRAGAVDLDHRGGGTVRGQDGRRRSYRIARLGSPAAGTWRFDLPGLADPAAWMLLQDSAVALRVLAPPQVAEGVATTLTAELYDRRTGERITDPQLIPGLAVSVEVDGRTVTLTDDGKGGDEQAGDGILSARVTFDGPGRRSLPVRLESDLLERTVTAETEVVEATWQLEVTTPAETQVDSPLELSARLVPLGDPARLTAPERIDVLTGGPEAVALRDDGQGADRQAGDRVYAGTWTPDMLGELGLDYVPVGGDGLTPRASKPLEVLGRLELGTPPPLDFGRLGSGEEAPARLDLGGARVRGHFEVQARADFDARRAVLEIDPGSGWVPLGEEPLTLELAEGGPRAWPLRLRVGSCPRRHAGSEPATLHLEATGAGGEAITAALPLVVTIVEDPWLVCWWPLLAALAGAVTAAVLVHGFVSPSRFPPRLGVVLSPEEDMSEGFFHPIRAVRGSGSGFYRDARVYVRPDCRLSARATGALACLRAAGGRVRIEPVGGAGLWRLNADDTAERLPPGESPARFGVVYRDELGTVYFEIRNG